MTNMKPTLTIPYEESLSIITNPYDSPLSGPSQLLKTETMDMPYSSEREARDWMIASIGCPILGFVPLFKFQHILNPKTKKIGIASFALAICFSFFWVYLFFALT